MNKRGEDEKCKKMSLTSQQTVVKWGEGRGCKKFGMTKEKKKKHWIQITEISTQGVHIKSFKTDQFFDNTYKNNRLCYMRFSHLLVDYLQLLLS